jgi:hypothetical protein
MTLARDEGDEHALVAALTQLAASAAAPVFVADGGSRASFVDRLRALPVHVVPVRGRGLVAQVRAALSAAAGAGARVLYTEPDKHDFFARHLGEFLAAAPSCNAAIVLGARSAPAFATFPAFQQLTESTFNQLCAEFVGVRTDYLYGPFLVDAPLVARIGSVADTVGWGWRPFLFATAAREGQRVASIVGDYECPPAQRGDEERLHRLRQLQQNVAGLLAATSSRVVHG